MKIEEIDGNWFVEFDTRLLVSAEVEQERYRVARDALISVNVKPDPEYVLRMVLVTLFDQEHYQVIKETSSGYFEYGIVRCNQSVSLIHRFGSYCNYRIMFREKSDAMMLKLRLGGNV